MDWSKGSVLGYRLPSARLLLLMGFAAIVAVACGSTTGTSALTEPTVASGAVSEASPERQEPTVIESEERLPDYVTHGWLTDFSIHSVPFGEIRSGGPGRDGIRPIDHPNFFDVSEAPEYMRDEEGVVSLEINGDARAYPLAIMIAHEIVNDEVGGTPVAVTYCPLCNTGVVFKRVLEGRALDFGTTGTLRRSDLIMWDRQTESWWQQITGEAIVGELTGKKLEFVSAQIVSWRQFRESFPNGIVLSRDTGVARNYDRPPYGGYDTEGSHPFLFRGEIDARLEAVERVVSVEFDGQAIAYPFALLVEHPVINDTFAGRDLVVFYVGGTLTPFPEADVTRSLGTGLGSRVLNDAAEKLKSIPKEDFMPQRAVGSAAVFEPFVDGQKLTFESRDGRIVDRETGSVWNILGKAVEGPLSGRHLEPVLHGNHFWFAWAAFFPETDVRTVQDLG